MRRITLGQFTAVLLATVALLTFGALLLPVDPYIRFQNLKGTIYSRVSWIYERIHDDPAPIDIVFLGTSRTGAGVYPTLLEPALAKRGIKANVVNFALPSSGFDIREAIAEEVFKARRPRLLVFDLVETFPRDGHEGFGNIATVREILGSPWLINRNLPMNFLRLPLRQISLFVESLVPEAFGKQRVFDPKTYAGTTLDPRSLLAFADDLSAIDTPEHLKKLTDQAAVRRRTVTPPMLPGNLGWVEFGVSRTYLERIVKLAEANGTKVVFLFLPFYTGPDAPLEQAYVEKFGPLWNAKFMKDDPRNYEDSAHSAATPRVKDMLTDWLAENIAGIWPELK